MLALTREARIAWARVAGQAALARAVPMDELRRHFERVLGDPSPRCLERDEMIARLCWAFVGAPPAPVAFAPKNLN